MQSLRTETVAYIPRMESYHYLNQINTDITFNPLSNYVLLDQSLTEVIRIETSKILGLEDIKDLHPKQYQTGNVGVNV